MFYWMNEAQQKEFARALDAIRSIYERYFAGDMLIALDRNMGFTEDARFRAAVEGQRPNAQESSLLWRLHVLCWCARNALALDGDFVECGVFRGFMSAVAMQYLDFGTRPQRWHLYDTFEGVPPGDLNVGQSSPPEFAQPGLYEAVAGRFAAYPNVVVHRGRVPEVLAETAPARIAFLHLDMNSAKAEVGALELLYDRLVTGAFVLLDDYGWFAYRAQKEAEDAFFGARGLGVLELPTGQGLVVKPGARREGEAS
jgi:O-methyltransferase